MLCRKATDLFVIPAPAFAGVNLSPQKRGAGIQKQKKQAWIPAGVHPALDAGRE
jgi:hypothetical protein